MRFIGPIYPTAYTIGGIGETMGFVYNLLYGYWPLAALVCGFVEV